MENIFPILVDDVSRAILTSMLENPVSFIEDDDPEEGSAFPGEGSAFPEEGSAEVKMCVFCHSVEAKLNIPGCTCTVKVCCHECFSRMKPDTNCQCGVKKQ